MGFILGKAGVVYRERLNKAQWGRLVIQGGDLTFRRDSRCSIGHRESLEKGKDQDGARAHYEISRREGTKNSDLFPMGACGYTSFRATIHKSKYGELYS